MCMVALALAGTAVSAIGAIQQGKASAAAYKADAELKEQQAEQEEKAAAIDAATERLNFRRHAGAARASVGGSGASSANFSEVFNDDFITMEREVAIIKQGGNNRSANLRTQANASRSKASNAKTAGYISALAGVFSGASKAYSLV